MQPWSISFDMLTAQGGGLENQEMVGVECRQLELSAREVANASIKGAGKDADHIREEANGQNCAMQDSKVRLEDVNQMEVDGN